MVHLLPLTDEQPPNQGPVPQITTIDVTLALRRIQNQKAAETDGIRIEVWNTIGSHGVNIFIHFFVRILLTK